MITRTVISRRIDHGLLSVTHETLFFGTILKRIKLETKQMNSLTYSLDLALSNKYLEVIIQCQEPKVSNEKVESLSGFYYFIE